MSTSTVMPFTEPTATDPLRDSNATAVPHHAVVFAPRTGLPLNRSTQPQPTGNIMNDLRTSIPIPASFTEMAA
jgi:hypothetical protein